jgi:hypothetical protein
MVALEFPKHRNREFSQDNSEFRAVSGNAAQRYRVAEDSARLGFDLPLGEEP